MLFLMLAATLACGDLCRAEAAAFYADLLARSGYGRLPVEQGGFLIRESDGSLTFASWPRGSFQRAFYRGKIPRGAVAVVHTHPRNLPDPSVHDGEEARRVGLPVVVVTPRAITAAWPDGRLQSLRQP